MPVPERLNIDDVHYAAVLKKIPKGIAEFSEATRTRGGPEPRRLQFSLGNEQMERRGAISLRPISAVPTTKLDILPQRVHGFKPMLPPRPTGWGKRGPPCALRCVSLGVRMPPMARTAPREMSEESQPQIKSYSAEREASILLKQCAARQAFDRSRRKCKQVRRNACHTFKQIVRVTEVKVWKSENKARAASPSTGSEHMKMLLPEVQRAFREELQRCQSEKAVVQASCIADRLMSLGPSEGFGNGGRFAYRLKEVIKGEEASCRLSFESLQGFERRKFQRLLAMEAKRRVSELKTSFEEAAAKPLLSDSAHTALAVPPSYQPDEGLFLTMGQPMSTQTRSFRRVLTPDSEDHICTSKSMPVRSFAMVEEPQPEIYRKSTEPRVISIDVSQDGLAIPPSPSNARKRITQAKTVNYSTSAAAAKERTKVGTAPHEDEEMEELRAAVAANQGVWKQAFDRYVKDGELHRDDLGQALELTGLTVNQLIMDEAIRHVTQYSTLRWDEFVECVRRYKQEQEARDMYIFTEHDEDASGTLEVSELKTLLERAGVNPMRHVLEEIVEEVDVDQNGSLSFPEFKLVLQILRKRSGFTASEYEEYMHLFERFDRDRSGAVDCYELVSILANLNFNIDPSEVDQIAKSVDPKRVGSLAERQYLAFMSKVRDMEITKMKKIIEDCDTDGNGTVDLNELQDVFTRLGFAFVDLEAVGDAAEAAGFDRYHNYDFSDLWKLVVIFRRNEGFTRAESNEISEGFRLFCKDPLGEVQTLDLGRLLRSLGYDLPFEVQKLLLSRVDVEGNSRLDVDGFRKFIRMWQVRELQMAREAYIAEDPKAKDLISLSSCRKALQTLECEGAMDFLKDPVWRDEQTRGTVMNQTKLTPRQSDKEDIIPLYLFAKAFIEARRKGRKQYIANGGFSAQEAERMKVCFQKYDSDGSGDISNGELIPLIEDLFPSLAVDPLMRPQLLELLKETQTGSEVDFPGFIRLMQHFHELVCKDQLERERFAVEQTAFSSREVEEFRDLFLATSDGKTQMTYSEVRQLLSTICPMGERNTTSFNTILERVVAESRTTETINDTIIFPEFLILMQKLLDGNWAGLSER